MAPQPTAERRRTMTTKSGRQIGYVFVEPRTEQAAKHRSTAVVYFYPLGCTSQVLEELFPEREKDGETSTADDNDYRCSFVCVDRPEYRDTSTLEELEAVAAADENDDAKPEQEDEFVHRIRRHADDVLQVLQRESITDIYVLGACLGHPFAIEVCRRVMASSSSSHSPKLHGLNLLAPFISPACPYSWNIARFGSFVPSMLLKIGTYAFTGFEHAMPVVALALLNLKAKYYGTTPESDRKSAKMTRLLGIVQEMNNSSTASSRAMEARLGVAESWQTEICDKFAQESGCGLVEDGESNEDKPSECKFPLQIHVCPDDKLVPLEAVQWIAKRCYGGTLYITIHHKHKSHGEMILFGGDIENPYLLTMMARDWGLLNLTEVENDNSSQ